MKARHVEAQPVDLMDEDELIYHGVLDTPEERARLADSIRGGLDLDLWRHFHRGSPRMVPAGDNGRRIAPKKGGER